MYIITTIINERDIVFFYKAVYNYSNSQDWVLCFIWDNFGTVGFTWVTMLTSYF